MLSLVVANQQPSGCILNASSPRAQRLINVTVEAENPLAHPIWLNCSVCAPTDPVVFVYIVMSADIILRIFLEAKPSPPPPGQGLLPRSRRAARGEKGKITIPLHPHEILTFRDGLKLSVIELVTHFNPINTSQQKPNLLQDRQGWGWGKKMCLQTKVR